MKCFVIARQSVGDNEDSLSIDGQLDECRKFCKKENLTVIDEFSDYNCSGRLYPIGFEEISKMDLTYQRWVNETNKKKFRVGLGQALRRLNEVDYIVCYDITRLHRSLNGSFLASIISQQLIANNVKIWTIKEGVIDFKKFTDELVVNLTSQINSEQLQIQKEKSKTSLKRLKDSGEWSVSCYKSFGYVSSGRNREVEIDEFKAEIVKDIFKEYIAGSTFYKISKKHSENLFNKTGKYLFQPNIVRILKNPIYCGYYKDSNGKLIKSHPNSGKEIISFETWKTAQEILEHRHIHPKRAYKNWLPLSGKIICGICGKTMFFKTSKIFNYYDCIFNRIRGVNKTCSCRNLIVWDSKTENHHRVRGDYLKDVCIGLLPIHYLNKFKISNNDSSLEEEKNELKIAIINLRNKLKTVNQAYIDGLMEDAEYQNMLKTISEKIKENKNNLDILNDQKNPGDYSQIDMLCDLEQLNHGHVEQSELEEGFRTVFRKIIVHKEHVEFDTSIGSISLPIRVFWRSRMLPFHQIIMDGKEIKCVFYFEDFEDETKWKSLLKIDGLEIVFSD